MRGRGANALVLLLAWGGAAAVWLVSGQISAVLVAAPLAWVLADALLTRRRVRLAARVAAAFGELVSEDDSAGFDGAQARVLAQRGRLFGALPPRLVELRLVEMPAGAHYLVRAELRAAGAPVAWRVTRLSPEQARHWRRELA